MTIIHRDSLRRLEHDQSMSLLVIDKDIVACPEKRKTWIRLGFSMAFLLFLSNLILLLILARKDLVGSADEGYSQSQRVMTTVSDKEEPPISTTTTIIDTTSARPSYSSHSLPRRLPHDFRMAQPSECPAATQKLTNFAPASMKSKIPYSQQKQFVMGGYQQIDKGSGDYKLVGPLVTKLSKVQHEQGIFGSVAELGVHHGRFTGALYMTARETEKLLAADLFEDLQYQNVDVSGFGNRQAFRQGLESYGLNETRDLHLVHTGSTEDLPFDWSGSAGFEPFRLISVDAGHTAGLTFNDLEIAFCNSLRGAIVILDDFFHNLWPGVTEGFFQFAAMGPVEGVYPFLRCEGKAFATNDKALHKHYYSMLRSEPKFKLFLSAYAHKVRGSKVKYMMNGVEYLKCDGDKLKRDTMHLLWNSLVY